MTSTQTLFLEETRVWATHISITHVMMAQAVAGWILLVLSIWSDVLSRVLTPTVSADS